MSLNFVTGKRGYAHISSADWRSLNRGIVGEGKFYLEDTELKSKGDFLVSASEGEISIPPRSFVWSGAHIRNDSLYIASYTPPVSTSKVVLWFHYTKDISTGIESIEFVTTVGSQPSPIADVIEDDTLEAYTEVYSFTHDAENLVAKDGTEFFENANSLKILEESTRLVANNLQEETNKRDMQKSDIDQDIVSLQAETQEIKGSFPNLKLKIKTLFSGSAKPSGTGISSLHVGMGKISDYFFFVVIRETENGTNVPMFIPAISGKYSFVEVYSNDVVATQANKTSVEEGAIYLGDVTNNSFKITYSSTADASYRDTVIAVYGYYY